jgi:hypothetical protein
MTLRQIHRETTRTLKARARAQARDGRSFARYRLAIVCPEVWPEGGHLAFLTGQEVLAKRDPQVEDAVIVWSWILMEDVSVRAGDVYVVAG